MSYNIFERWPFTSFQNLNLDWILKAITKAGEDATEALEKAQTALNTTASYSDRIDQIGQQAGTAFEIASDSQQAAEAAQTSASTANSLAVTAGQDAQTGITNAAAAQTAADNAQTTANTALSNANEALYRLANAVGVYEYTLTGSVVYDKNNDPASSTEMIDEMSDGVMPLLKDSSTGEIYLPVDIDGQQIKFFSPQLVGGSVAIQYGYLVTVGTSGSATKTRYAIGASGGSGVFLITATYDSTNQKYSFNKSAAEITAAIGNGMLPVVQIYSELGSQYDRLWFVFTHSSFDGEDTYFNFVCLHDVSLIRYMQFVASESRAVIYNREAVPEATSQDEGKILTVNSFGYYQLVTPSASSGTPRISMASTDTMPALDANRFYVFPEMASLSVSLNSPASNAIVNEYHFRFTSGSTATQLDLPATVEIPDDFDVAANTVYEISIIDNYMVFASWAVTV